MKDVTTEQMLEYIEGVEGWADGGGWSGIPSSTPEAIAIRYRIADYDALKAEVERLDGAYKWLSQTNSDLVEMREKSESERDEWRGEAMFQKGRADECLRELDTLRKRYEGAKALLFGEGKDERS